MTRLYTIGSPQPTVDIPPPQGDTNSQLVDAFGRRLTYLRVSVTDRCNLRCFYCLPEDADLPSEDRDFLSPADLEVLVGSLVRLGVQRVRLTGGEPLVRKDILEIVSRLRALPGLQELSLSTNGTELDRLAPDLRKAGLDRVNISLDTLDPETFREITKRGDLEKVWDGIEAALSAGLQPVKLNAVLLAESQPAELDRLVELTRNRPLSVRFIEMMPTESNQQIQPLQYLSSDVVRERIETHFGKLEPVVTGPRTGPAKEFQIPGFEGSVGFITPMSHTFCHDCNRLRMTARGELRLCLFANRVFPLRPLLSAQDPQTALEQRIQEILKKKPEEHHLTQGNYGNLVSFMEIGG